MTILNRRYVLTGLLAGVSYIPFSSAHAQSTLTEEQRREYARQFQTSGATGRELSVLRDIQEGRAALPSGIENLGDFITQSPAMEAMATGQTPELGMLKFWHDLSLEASSLDHTTDAQDLGTYAEQFGPTRASRALAITHLAVFEAVNAISRKIRELPRRPDCHPVQRRAHRGSALADDSFGGFRHCRSGL